MPMPQPTPGPMPAPIPAGPGTFTLSAAPTLMPDGGMAYPSGMVLPSFVASRRGRVAATATFSPIAGCQFVLYVCHGNCMTSDVLGDSGGGPTLGLEGKVDGGLHDVLLGARRNGHSMCSGVPPAGIRMPYTVVVTVP